MATTVVERESKSVDTGRDNPPEFHIYDVGSRVALCGHRRSTPKVTPRPFVKGALDCETCWRLHAA